MAVYPERRGARLTGKWIAEVTAGGDRRRKRFDTKLDGERWADFCKLTGDAPPEAKAKPLGPTFGTVAQEAKDTKPAWQRGRDVSGMQRLEKVIEMIGPDTPIADVTTNVLDGLIRTLRKHKSRNGTMTTGTMNRYMSAVSAVLTFAVKRNYLAAAPTVPWQKETGKRLHWLTEAAEDEVVSLMLQDGENACALTLRVLTATGMRWGEFASLEPAQIDGEWIRLWETKTDDPRSVPIDPELARALKAQNTLPNYYTFRKVLKAALKTAGQSPDICIHSLRHTTATRLVQKGVNLAIVQKFLGHKTITTTMRYVKIADDDLQIASRKITHRAGQSDKSADLVSEKAE